MPSSSLSLHARKVPATRFQKETGRYLDLAQREPVTVTSHGRDKVVLLSVPEYERLLASAAQGDAHARHAPETSGTGRGKVNDPLTTALSVINTATPVAINKQQLLDAIHNPRTKFRAQARLLVNDVSANILAGLVTRKVATWQQLADLANRVGVDSDEKATFLRDMAGLPVG